MGRGTLVYILYMSGRCGTRFQRSVFSFRGQYQGSEGSIRCQGAVLGFRGQYIR